MKTKLLNSRRFKHGSLATIITVGFIIAIVLINIIATLLLERFPLTIDLSGDNRFKLTQDSIDYVKKIDQNVKITICSDEITYSNSGTYYKQAYEIIKNYAKYSNKISIDFIDLEKNPQFDKKYPEQDLQRFDILLSTDMRNKKLSTDSLFEEKKDQTGNVATSSNAEQIMTSAIMYVTDKNPATVSLLTGKDNVNVDGYKTLLEANNYSVEEQNILTEEINSKSSFVILPQPSTDLSADESKKISAFLDNNGKFDKSLVFIASPNVEIGPVLKNFLADWGIEIGNDIVTETDPSHAIQSQFFIINEIGDPDFGNMLSSKEAPIISMVARPIKTLFTEKDNRKTKVLTKSYDTAILTPAEEDPKFDPSKAEKRSFNTMVIGSRSESEGTTPHTSNVVAISTATMVESGIMSEPSYANNDAMISMTNMISSKKDEFKVLPINFDSTTFAITKAQVTTIFVIFVILIPVVIIALGIVIWLRRRHL